VQQPICTHVECTQVHVCRYTGAWEQKRHCCHLSCIRTLHKQFQVLIGMFPTRSHCLMCFAVHPCSAVFWLSALAGACAIALLPDLTVMLFRRYFRPDIATLLQVGSCRRGEGSNRLPQSHSPKGLGRLLIVTHSDCHSDCLMMAELRL